MFVGWLLGLDNTFIMYCKGSFIWCPVGGTASERAAFEAYGSEWEPLDTIYYYIIYRRAAAKGAYSSVVEQYTDNVKVGGSNPPRLT